MTSRQEVIERTRATRFTNGRRAEEMGRKGGQVQSIRKRQAATLREWRRRGFNDRHVMELLSRMESPETDLLHIRQSIANMKRSGCVKTVKDATAVMQLELAAHKAQYGEKKDIKVEHGLSPSTMIESFEVWKNELHSQLEEVPGALLHDDSGADENTPVDEESESGV